MKREKFFTVAIAAIFLLTWAAAFTVQANQIVRSELIPLEVAYACRVSNTSQFDKRFSESPLGRLWVDPEFKKLVGDFDIEKFLQKKFIGSETPENYAALTAEQKAKALEWEQLQLATGELIIASNVNIDESGLFVAAECDQAAFMKNLDYDRKIMALRPEQKGQFETYDFEGITIHEAITTQNGEPRRVWQAWLKNTALASDKKEWVEKAVLKLKRNDLNTSVEGEPSITLTIRARGITGPLLEQEKTAQKTVASQNASGKPSMEKIFRVLGLFAVKDVTVSLTPSARTIDLDARISGPMANPIGLWKALDTKPVSTSTRLPYASDDTYSYSVTRFNLKRLWEQIPILAEKLDPAWGMSFNMGVTMIQQNMKLNIATDFIDPLGTEYIGLERLEKDHPGKLMAITLQDAERFEKTLVTLMEPPALPAGQSPMTFGGSLGSLFKAETFLDHKVYVLELPEQIAANAQNPLSMAISVAGGHLLAGEGGLVRDMIRAFVRTPDQTPTFFNSLFYHEAEKELPEGSFSFTFVNIPTYWKSFLQEINNPAVAQKLKGIFSGPFAPPFLADNPDLAKKIDEALAPEKQPKVELIGKYLSALVTCFWVDGENLRGRIRLTAGKE